MIINNIEVIGKEFIYDGCHKIYIVEDQEDREIAYRDGYIDSDFYPIEEIESVFNNSCSLRFISNVSLTRRYADQFEKADFNY